MERLPSFFDHINIQDSGGLKSQLFKKADAYLSGREVNWNKNKWEIGRTKSVDELARNVFLGVATLGLLPLAALGFKTAYRINIKNRIEGEKLFQKAMEAKQENRSEIQLLGQAARMGNAQAMVELGRLHLSGDGVQKDERKGARLMEKAAKLGNRAAMTSVGIMYRYGEGKFPKDINKAIDWLTKAANQEDRDAMVHLGNLYLEGEGKFHIDINKAIDWYEIAAKKGDPDAMVQLGNLYDEGNPYAIAHLDTLRKRGENIGDKLTEANKLFQDATTKFKKAADDGDANAMLSLGLLYLEGKVVEENNRVEDKVAAAKWFIKSAEQGNRTGMYYAGICYLIGRGTEQSDKKAFEWFQKGLPESGCRFHLAVMYEMGRGFDKKNVKDPHIRARHLMYGVEENAKLEFLDMWDKSSNNQAQKFIDAIQKLRALGKPPA
jgi:TPR repeat protein